MDIRSYCPKCRSKQIVKDGTRPKWKGGVKRRVQYMLCNNCGKQFPERKE